MCTGVCVCAGVGVRRPFCACASEGKAAAKVPPEGAEPDKRFVVNRTELGDLVSPEPDDCGERVLSETGGDLGPMLRPGRDSAHNNN